MSGEETEGEAMDTDLEILEQLSATVTAVDRKYRRASFNDKLKLKKQRDELFNAYAKARLKLLEDGLITGDAELEEMKEIRSQIAHAREVQSILIGVARLVKFAARLVV